MDALFALLLAAAAGPMDQIDQMAQMDQTDSGADYRLVNPRAIELFERDPRLMQWGVAFFDINRDGRLSIREADLAAQQFKRIADGDKDGRVTPTEYRSAREFIVARWAVR